jgi:hypothetical protein
MLRPAVSVLLLAVTLHAQLTEATLKGIVRDPSGAVIVQAAVSVVHLASGLSRAGATDHSGNFVLTGLPPGAYRATIQAPQFQTLTQSGLRLGAGQTVDSAFTLTLGAAGDTIHVTASTAELALSRDARLAENFDQRQILELPVPQRDVFGLPKLSAGATAIPGAASSTKLTNSPVITVNGNRYRGNEFVLDGAINVNPNNTGEPAIVPTLDSVEEVQVQTGNFSSEFGRGNGSVVNLRTRSGGNEIHGRAWAYHRNTALNARNFFAPSRPPVVYNQSGANLGGPIRHNRTFYFLSYEATRNAVGSPQVFQVETPEFRDYVRRVNPNGVASRLLDRQPAPVPLPATGAPGRRYADQVDLSTPLGVIPALGRASVILKDHLRFDQVLARLDHSWGQGRHRLSGRWISEWQANDGATSSSRATLGRAVRGSRGPFDGLFGNFNLGHTLVIGRAVNDLRVSLQTIRTATGNPDAAIPDITVTGLAAPFGDVFPNRTVLRTYEIRETFSQQRGAHLLRAGFDYRRIFKGLSLAPPTAGSFAFNNLLDFALDRPFRQTLTVHPATGAPTNFPRHFTIHEAGLFLQDDWRFSPRLTLNLGLRYNYFGAPNERDGLLSSIVFGPGDDFSERLSSSAVTRVPRLYSPQRLNFAPRVGLAWDLTGHGATILRLGSGLAFQPHHGQSIGGARALPPDAVQGVLQPNVGIGSSILYGIPVPLNPEFASVRVRATGFVVNPEIKTQYTVNAFLNVQQRLARGWIAEAGYVGTRGVNLERIDDVNRRTGDLLDGREDRVNSRYSTLLFVTNGVTSDYHALTAELRRPATRSLSVQVNYRWSKWLDTASDTSTGQFFDNAEPGKGAQEIGSLRLERARSMFDIPHRLTGLLVWSPRVTSRFSWLRRAAGGWELSLIAGVQSGRPFSVWNGASFQAGGDYNADNGGGAVGGGFYDRPNAPAVMPASFSRQNFLSGLFPPTLFPAPAPGVNGSLGRNTFRGPRQFTNDAAVSRSFSLRDRLSIQLRAEAYNLANAVNLALPNADLALALRPDRTFSTTSAFGKSTTAFDARTFQLGARLIF